MAKLLPKGAAVPVAGGLTEILFRAKWDTNDDPNDPMDVDTFVVGRDANGNLVKLPGLTGHPLNNADYGNLTPVISGYMIAPAKGGKYPNSEGCTANPFNWIIPAEDERTGAAAGWDEESKIILSLVPAEIARLDMIIAIYPLNGKGDPNGHTFGMVNNCACEVADATTGQTKYPVDSAFQSAAMWGFTGIWVASLIRTSTGWDIKNVGHADNNLFTYYHDFADAVVKDIPTPNI